MQGVLDLPKDLAPLGDHLAELLADVSARFDRQLASDVMPVSALVRHVERYHGKMLRPTLVLLCGIASSAVPGDPRKAILPHHITAAAVCEMVHLATLVHDDVLDEAEVRRHAPTINTLHGNEAAVILGDYLIAAAYHLCSQITPGDLSRRAALAVGKASMVVCSGELLQLHHRGDVSLNERTYFRIVEKKTGELVAVSCELGAAISGASDRVCEGVADFGRKVGIAFQIQDDLLDLMGAQAVVGKSVGKDVEKGKVTLPIIHHLAAAKAATRERSIELLTRPQGLGEGKAELLAAMDETQSVQAAGAVAARLIAEAKAHLQVLAESPARRLLSAMADAVIAREF